MPGQGRSSPTGLCLPCPSASTAQSQQSPGTDPARTLAQPHRRDHACGTLSLSPVCMLCHQTQADTDICGNMSVKAQLCVHTYCQVTSLAAPPSFLPILTLRGLLCSFQSCFICCKMGASITCCETSCPRTFHLPCAPDGECITQYFGTYRSFCWEHRPQQALHPLPSQDNTCSICLDTVEDRISYKTMGCPACQDTRFHRHCIQRLALHSGIAFRCPCCLNQELFMMEMLTMGIRLSKRPWQLWLCSSCAARGTHRHCPSLGNGKYTWECNTCAPSHSSSSRPRQGFKRGRTMARGYGTAHPPGAAGWTVRGSEAG
uniref:PHD finger protein 7-like n=1 Tax=Catharus ustulatus TaxID=91951 RepID=A0A8C3Y3N8_CATUS